MSFQLSGVQPLSWPHRHQAISRHLCYKYIALSWFHDATRNCKNIYTPELKSIQYQKNLKSLAGLISFLQTSKFGERHLGDDDRPSTREVEIVESKLKRLVSVSDVRIDVMIVYHRLTGALIVDDALSAWRINVRMTPQDQRTAIFRQAVSSLLVGPRSRRCRRSTHLNLILIAWRRKFVRIIAARTTREE